MSKFERLNSVGSPTTIPGAQSDTPESPPSIYPPLLISEPYVDERKRAALNGIMKYKRFLDENRARFTGDNFVPNGFFKPPDFSGLSAGAKSKMTRKADIAKKLEELEKVPVAEESDTEDELLPSVARKPKAAPEEDAEAEEQEVKDEDEDEEVLKSDSDIDDYTANAGFDDDEADFNESGGEKDADADTF